MRIRPFSFVRIKPFFRWFDLWVGAYVDVPNRALFVCPIPMFGIKVTLDSEHDAPFVCPGCYAVGDERCHPDCVDAEIERAAAERDRYYDSEDFDECDEPFEGSS